MTRGWGGQSRLERLKRTRGVEEAIRITEKPTVVERVKREHKKRVRAGTHRRVDVPACPMKLRDGTTRIRKAFWYSIPMSCKVERTEEEADKLTEDIKDTPPITTQEGSQHES